MRNILLMFNKLLFPLFSYYSRINLAGAQFLELRAAIGTDFGFFIEILKNKVMLRWILIFVVLAIIFAVLGFGGIAEGFADIAEILFYIFLVLIVIALVMRLVRG